MFTAQQRVQLNHAGVKSINLNFDTNTRICFRLTELWAGCTGQQTASTHDTCQQTGREFQLLPRQTNCLQDWRIQRSTKTRTARLAKTPEALATASDFPSKEFTSGLGKSKNT
jgi:hypothetical protein